MKAVALGLAAPAAARRDRMQQTGGPPEGVSQQVDLAVVDQALCREATHPIMAEEVVADIMAAARVLMRVVAITEAGPVAADLSRVRVL